MRLEALDFRHMGDLAYNAIRDAILAGQLEPGAHLSQDDLARQLGVSRAPVRDALNRLEAEGLVRTAPRKGVVVARMTARELLDVFEMRALIDGYAARKACGLLEEADLGRLQQTVEAADSLAGGVDLHGLVQAHADFHYIIYDACGNAELGRVARNLWDRSYRYRVTGLLNPPVAASSLEDHRAILRAFHDRDSQRAEELAAQHCQHTIDRLLGQVGASAELDPTGSPAALFAPIRPAAGTPGLFPPLEAGRSGP